MTFATHPFSLLFCRNLFSAAFVNWHDKCSMKISCHQPTNTEIAFICKTSLTSTDRIKALWSWKNIIDLVRIWKCHSAYDFDLICQNSVNFKGYTITDRQTQRQRISCFKVMQRKPLSSRRKHRERLPSLYGDSIQSVVRMWKIPILPWPVMGLCHKCHTKLFSIMPLKG